MRVVVVGKTKMYLGTKWCIGALRLRDWSSLRLLPLGGDKAWPGETKIQVGEVYEIEGFRPNPIVLPHSEDFRLTALERVGAFEGNLPQSICDHVRISQRGGTPLFQDCLSRVQKRSLAVLHANVPSFSTQFWVADRDLHYTTKWDKDYYRVGDFEVSYVGYQPVIQKIPEGSLVRLSLARWWGPDGEEEGCYLQVSGWWLPPEGGSW